MLIPAESVQVHSPIHVQCAPVFTPNQTSRQKRREYRFITVGILVACAVIIGVVAGLGFFETQDSTNDPTDDPTNSKDCPLADNGWTPAEYVNQSSFTQTCVFVHDSIWEMSGALTIPIGDGPFPAMVLLGGSGPTDMDGSMGKNKMLKDLAWGLSSQGIAVLRFNKRTFQYGVKSFPNNSYEQFTFADEYTNDALAALSLLSTYPRIDPNRIILTGHSLGAEVTPGTSIKYFVRVSCYFLQ